MGQIVRRKKKGRPSKADLERRLAMAGGEAPAEETPEIRRSHRRRNARYSVIDYDDYLDVDDEEDGRGHDDDDEEEDERRREKKLKLVVKLIRDDGAAARAAAESEDDEERSEEDDGDGGEMNRRKKRRINGRVGGGGDEDDEDDAVCRDEEDEEEEERARKVDSKRLDSVPGTPTEPRTGIPLPEKKTLELILDKLQKKDTYGVYAEPVDPEELPDYHDVIEHPMDFATVRKKLADGSYSTLDQLESDIFLICSNAMQYNAPETVYHKQARAIQELGRKKFEKLRIKFESSEKEMKLAQKLKTNSSVKKQMKKPLYQTPQETVGSDFSSGATLATAGEILNSFNLTQGVGCERPNYNDGPVDANPPLNDAHLEKAEEASSAKSYLSKLGRKPVMVEENRRSSYNVCTQPVAKSDSVFKTFESEIKQLVAVGLHAEYSYARSMARFAATLGPIAWKVASQRIEQALPAGCKFGRGWVGEYEPLPTPVLMLESHKQKQKQSASVTRNDERAFKTPVPMKEKTESPRFSEGRQSLFAHPSRGPQSESKPSAFSSTGKKTGQQSAQPRNFPKPETVPTKQVELNSLPTANQSSDDLSAEKPFSRNPEAAAGTRHKNLMQSVPFKIPDSNGVGSGGALPNGKDIDTAPNHKAPRGPTHFAHGPEQGLNDSVPLMKALGEKTQKQPKPSDHPTSENQPSILSLRREDPGNAAAAAARAWMSIGAGAFKQPAENPNSPKSQISADSLYNPARESARIRGEFPIAGPTHQFQPDKNGFPVPSFFPQPVHFMNDPTHFPTRPVMFPPVAAADLSRFQIQSPWRGLSPHALPRQKPDTLPPDLNIGFQSPQSPVKQSSGVMVESQQPDLALQL